MSYPPSVASWTIAAILAAYGLPLIAASRRGLRLGPVVVMALVPPIAWYWVLTHHRATATLEPHDRPDTAAADGSVVVYRAVMRNGTVGYIGISDNPTRRWAQHQATQPWADAVERWEIIGRYRTRDAATVAERTLIESTRPPFNRQHNPDSLPARRR